MTKFNIPGAKPDQRLGISKAEKRKLIGLVAAFFLIMVVFSITFLRSQTDETAAVGDLPPGADDLPVEEIDLPAIDRQKFEDLAHDRRPEDRVILESDAIDAALDLVRLLTPRHFEELGARELDEPGIAAILADPPGHRVQAYTMRGWVDTLRQRRRNATATEEHIGRLVLEDRSVAYFLTLGMPETFIAGDFVRIDGVFLQAYSEEDSEQSGKWIEGPMIVGPRAVRSYPAMGEVTELRAQYLMGLRDEVLMLPDGSINSDVERGLPFDALWHVMAFVRDLPPDAIDWSKAPQLDNATLMKVMMDGDANRIQPFRIPVSRLQHATVRRAEENPARIEYFTEGWIGNSTWNNVVYFRGPFENREARLANFATARGFFFKNHAYESAGRSVRVAPVFILQSLDIFEPKASPIFAVLAYTLAGLTLFLIAVFFIQLLRDRRNSIALQEKLTQRRRARREKDAAANQMGASTP